MAAHRKFPHLLALGADVVVIPECAAPDVAPATIMYGAASASEWVGGQNRHKGLAVLAFGKYSIARVAGPRQPGGRFALAVRVRGPLSFRLLAIWSQRSAVPHHPYVRSSDAAVTDYEAFLRPGPSIVAGDFNTNVRWDAEHDSEGHGALVQRLQNLGLVSAYHSYFNERQGEESRPTYFQSRRRDKGFHTDYVFLPRAWADSCRVDLGDPSAWLGHSDHMPLVVRIEPSTASTTTTL